jgi:hypothetical protein
MAQLPAHTTVHVSGPAWLAVACAPLCHAPLFSAPLPTLGAVEQIRRWPLLTVYNRIKLQVDLQADKSPVVVKGPFFSRVVNPRY